MTEQNGRHVQKEVSKLLSGIWRIKGLAEQKLDRSTPITKKLASMHEEVQSLRQENS